MLSFRSTASSRVVEESLCGDGSECVDDSMALLSSLPVFEWDDSLVSARSTSERGLASLLREARSELEVRPVLEPLLLLTGRTERSCSHSLASESPVRTLGSQSQVASLAPSPLRSSRGVWTPRSEPLQLARSPSPSASASNASWTTASWTTPVRRIDRSAVVPPVAGIGALAGGGSSMPFLHDSARTSPVYVLDDTASVASPLLNDTLGGSLLGGLNLSDLFVLGRSPERKCLSDEQARSLPRVKFESPEMQTCSICLEAFRHGMLLTGLGCGHAFHVNCIAQWVQRSVECPNCRAAIKPG